MEFFAKNSVQLIFYMKSGVDHTIPTVRMKERTNFNLLDILRILGGLILLNAFLSWHFTSTKTWGYDGKWVNPRYLKHICSFKSYHFTLEELSLFDGSDPNLPIYLAINGSVFDVTASPQIYGPKGSYSFFSGKDAARAFVTGCFKKEDEFTYDLRNLDSTEAEADIKSWQNFFLSSGRYFYVGTVEHPPLVGEPPALCSGKKFPH
ncbi:hypothetical protein PUMCH_004167 [Australozyma saopauloensis]|uniref:Cytochrome b5 heme-binding domain-containing protein n=1 Tax=Australozyma saopauloensis TaxID=291208 RepID=A0AAX4HEI9_9ASCO|nr:hypothetical protein PUMCH_004167 [[Candida] saopauloensis]